MARYLVVANQTLGGARLRDELVRLLQQDGTCEYHLVVPATPLPGKLTWTEAEARTVATRRLATAVEEVGRLGAAVTGEVGDASPMHAIGDALRRDEYDGIVLSTLPPGVSKWLGQDLPRRVRRSFGLPVIHVVAEAHAEHLAS